MISLPERFDEFAEARREGFIKVKELKESGAMICGTFCQYAPIEIIAAAGLYRVSLCGRSVVPIASAETRLPKNLCPLIKASYGHAMDNSCPYMFFSDLVVGETTCDGKKKMYEMLSELKPMHVIHLPNVPDYERSLASWVEELQLFKEKLEEHFQIEITDEMLRQGIKKGNRDRIQAARIYELGRYDPPAITGIQMNDIMDGEQYLFDDEMKHEKLKSILDMCEKNWHNNQGPYPKNCHPPRIMVSGGGISGAQEKTINVIEELGGAIVCYEGCGGISSRRRLIDESPDRDPIVCIAEKYLEVPCAVMSPNFNRMQQVKVTIDEWKIDGVISITLHSCHPFGIETYNIGRVCSECGIPYLHIETDFSPGDEGQIRTKIGAFLEILGKKK